MIAAGLLAVLLAAAPSPRLLSPGLWHHQVPTGDGVQLSLFRYVPAVPRTGPAVLLVPELGFTRASFDLDGFGLAPYLQREGREVFVLEARGQGLSSAPSSASMSLREIVRNDLPRAIAEVRRLSGGKPDLVGHGFGGTLLLAAVADREEVGRVIALGTPVEPALPNRRLAQALEGTSAFGADAEAFEFLFLRSAVISADRVLAIREATLRPLPAIQREEWLGWMREGELTLGEGDSVKRRLEKLTAPTYLVLPLLSYVGHPEYASPLRDLHPQTVKVRLLSKLYLHREDYTHLSVLLGDGAPVDVFAPLLHFLEGGE